ncbi:hypothetical protein LSH36_147g09024 [Paralvinella palmiformis]|uniref:Uncharacterized protein n=1 Tax=Paralvinella palmiformis TaxID=53620 RepID=A0AAD9NA70_9ANNE|nr:hypothetical protein LSH36_147g09024 [Paralvinella palmiformis]
MLAWNLELFTLKSFGGWCISPGSRSLYCSAPDSSETNYAPVRCLFGIGVVLCERNATDAVLGSEGSILNASSLSDNAEKTHSCHGDCQHTSCRACHYVKNDEGCGKCSKDDFNCIKAFGRCIKQEFCSRRKFPCKSNMTTPSVTADRLRRYDGGGGEANRELRRSRPRQGEVKSPTPTGALPPNKASSVL